MNVYKNPTCFSCWSVSDYTKRAKTDNSLKGIRSNRNFDLADKIIRNTYRTLLSRGQKGCYIYCEDKELLKYISKKLNKEIIMQYGKDRIVDEKN